MRKPQPRPLPQLDLDTMIAVAVAYLRGHGYEVVDLTGRPYETPAAYARRIGIKPGAFSARVRHKFCPAFDGRYGKTGRLVALRPNAALETFLRRPVAKGRRLERVVLIVDKPNPLRY